MGFKIVRLHTTETQQQANMVGVPAFPEALSAVVVAGMLAAVVAAVAAAVVVVAAVADLLR